MGRCGAARGTEPVIRRRLDLEGRVWGFCFSARAAAPLLPGQGPQPLRGSARPPLVLGSARLGDRLDGAGDRFPLLGVVAPAVKKGTVCLNRRLCLSALGCRQQRLQSVAHG